MLLSSGVVWRYRDWERFRAECPGGDPALQRLVWERLDEASHGSSRSARRSSQRETGQPADERRAFRPARAHRGPAARARRDPARRAAHRAARRRSRHPRHRRFPGGARTSCAATSRPEALARPAGEPLEHRRRPPAGARARGASSPRAWTSSTGATLPPRPRLAPDEFVALAQVYARHARVENARGERLRGPHLVGDRRRPVDGAPAGRGAPGTSSRTSARRARAGAHGRRADRRGPAGRRARRSGRRRHRVEVVAGITTTLGGLGGRARLARPKGSRRREPTSAASRPAAGRAPSPRRSSSARSRPRTLSARLSSGRLQVRAGARVAAAAARGRASRRRSGRLSVELDLAPGAGRLARRARRARSRSGGRRRAGTCLGHRRGMLVAARRGHVRGNDDPDGVPPSLAGCRPRGVR